MNREAFRALAASRPVILDGATGTNLQKAGMPTGVCPEAWILEHPEVLIRLQRAFSDAGTDILYAPTFTANRIKLAEYGLSDRLTEMNRALVALSKEAAGPGVLVAGDMTMTGQSLEPMGPMKLDTLISVYREQAEVLQDAGVDLFVVETMMSLPEARAAILGIREVSDLPIMVTMTFNEDGRTLYGTTPEAAVVVLQSLGADAVGVNCSTGPEQMISVVQRMKAYANVPIIAKPNNGMPELLNGETVYRTTPEEFASFGPKLLKAGASILGGCCGTEPAHIRALSAAVSKEAAPVISSEKRRVLASERKILELSLDGPFVIIGERINPTGKKLLQSELRAGSLDLVLTFAEEQERDGAAVLDINMGMNGISEHDMMLRTIQEVGTASDLPLCIDSSHVDIIEAALRAYPGRALINSISLEEEKCEKLLPIAAKYGAMFILLPLSDAGLPKDSAEKIHIIETVSERAYALGMCREDIIVDGLVATVGADPLAAVSALDTIRYCKEHGFATSIGLSNISFGLPERPYVNAAFAGLCVEAGLTMAIANPKSALLRRQLVKAKNRLGITGPEDAAWGASQDETGEVHLALHLAKEMLLNHEGASDLYLEYAAVLSEKKELKKALEQGKAVETVKPAKVSEKPSNPSSESPVYTCVLKGRDRAVVAEIDRLLENGMSPEDVISSELIPAIQEVGILFEKKKYFLPQLMASAETMKTGVDYLKPMLTKRENTGKQVTIVIATVEGDIHDIGKNLVALLLENYGFRVIDLGKDVPKGEIFAAAIREHADIIALSALMTTTMMRMKDVVELVRREKPELKVIIGGAVVTQSFADEIGADGYSKDAQECVKLVQRLMA